MCLIIQREPNFEIPYEKFETAILNNGDGYGVAIPDEHGILQVLRSAKEPDPEKLYRILNEDLIDKRVLLHLRYTTAGETNLRNSHPFPILEKNKDGVDLRMAHNGTLHKYKNLAAKGESDTRAFVREYVRPLFKRMSRGMDPEEMLNDPFIKELLEDKLTAMSVLSFIDGEGNTLNCNAEGNGGKQEEGWYYSNTYSFNELHRKPVTPLAKNYYQGYGYDNRWEDHYYDKSKYKTKENSKVVTPSKTSKTFLESFDLTSIEDISLISDETINKLCVEMPVYSEKLIKDLIRELYHADIEITKLKAKVKEVSK